MSDAGESGDIKESFVEDANKIDIEPTVVNLGCVKNESNEEALDFEEDSQATQYRITLEYENIFGEPSHHLKIEEDYDNLIGFSDNDAIMENAKVKLEAIKKEDDGSFNNLHFVLTECHYCKMWLEKWEHEEHHVASCLEKHHRMSSGYSETVDRNDANVEAMGDDCGRKDDKRTYPRDICSRPKDRRDDLQSDRKDYQGFSGGTHGTCLIESALSERSNNEQVQNTIEIDNKSHLQKLLNKHSGIKPYKCDICLMEFSQNGSLKNHIKHKHRDERATKDYKCFECSYQTKDKSHFQRHQNKHTGIRPFTCDICMMQFTRKDYLKTHTRNKHTDDINGKDYKCSECSYQTNYKHHLQNHVNIHSDIKSFTCDICMAKFTKKDSLKMHIKDKHTDDGGGKHYKCSECSYQTNGKRNIQRHVNKHSEIKLFKCDICLKEYTDKGALIRHIRYTHTTNAESKNYECLECSFQTKYKSSLQNHLTTHTGIKRFTCDICMMKFTKNNNLKRHIKNKHADGGSAKDYQCSECTYQTNSKSHFERHQNKHRGITFTCDICMAKFTRKDHLKTHIKKKHTDNGNRKD